MKLSYRNEKTAKIIAEYWNKSLDKPDWYSIKNLDEDEVELFIYDYIGWPYNDAGELVRIMADIKHTPILARINSPGGDVWDGMALLNAFANHPGGVTVRIESLAASIASVLAMGGKKVQAYSNTMMMIHNSWVFIAGNKEELIEFADILGQIDENIVGAYTDKTKLGKKEIRSIMTGPKGNGTYMNAKKMKEKGFIDEILKSGKAAKAEFDLSMFANAPEDILTVQPEGGRELTIREIEQALRDAGASRKFAKAKAAGCSETPLEPKKDEVDDANQWDAEIADNLKTIIVNMTGGK